MSDHKVAPKDPKEPRSLLRIFAALLGAFLSGLYLLNLSMGILEVPDNLPLVGNLYEVAVSAFFFGCLSYLGIDLVPFRQKPRK